MNLTDEELDSVYGVVYDKAYYGDDHIVYGPEGDDLRAALRKIEAEMKKRGML